MNIILNLDEIITVNLTCLEQGLDNKAVVRENILKAIAENCLSIREPQELEDFPARLYQTLHERLGMSFEVHDGKITALAK